MREQGWRGLLISAFVMKEESTIQTNGSTMITESGRSTRCQPRGTNRSSPGAGRAARPRGAGPERSSGSKTCCIVPGLGASPMLGSVRSLTAPSPLPRVDEADDDGREAREEQDVRHGGAIAGREEVEGQLPDVVHERDRRPQRTAPRRSEHQVEELEGVDDPPHEQEHRHGAHGRKDDRSEDRPVSRRRSRRLP